MRLIKNSHTPRNKPHDEKRRQQRPPPRRRRLRLRPHLNAPLVEALAQVRRACRHERPKHRSVPEPSHQLMLAHHADGLHLIGLHPAEKLGIPHFFRVSPVGYRLLTTEAASRAMNTYTMIPLRGGLTIRPPPHL